MLALRGLGTVLYVTEFGLVAQGRPWVIDETRLHLLQTRRCLVPARWEALSETGGTVTCFCGPFLLKVVEGDGSFRECCCINHRVMLERHALRALRENCIWF